VVVQHDLDRLVIRRRRLRRTLAVVMVISLAALLLGVMRSCGNQFDQPYNKDYAPMDTARPGNGEAH